jgi:hypothetical protein
VEMVVVMVVKYKRINPPPPGRWGKSLKGGQEVLREVSSISFFPITKIPSVCVLNERR